MEANQWNLAFEVLSLDGISPLYEEMGLRIQEKQQFVDMLRRLITESRETYTPGRTPDIRFAEKVLKEIESLFGQDTGEHFYRWATTVFYWVPSYQPGWSAWDSLLPRHPAKLPKGLPSERWEAIAQFREETTPDDLTPRIIELKKRPLTQWDAEMYSLHNYSNKDDPMFEDELVDPYSPVESTIEMNRFQLGWPKLWSKFTDQEKGILWNYGKQWLRDERLEDLLPGGLPHPDELRRQI